MVALNFNMQDVEISSNFDPIPVGQYAVAITNSTEKPTKAGNGHNIILELTILDGPFKNRKIFDTICYDHPNTVTREIAKKTIATIGKAIGVVARDTVELHDRPLMASIAQDEGNNGLMRNVVKRYYAQKNKTNTEQSPQNQQTQSTGTSKPNWMNHS